MANKNTSIVGKKIKEIRKERNLSQTDLGRIAKISQRLISRYENSIVEPTIANLRKLSKALQVSADYLVFDGERKEEVEFANPRLKESFLAANNVDKKDQEIVIKIVEAIVVKNKVRNTAKNIE